jgi:carbon-monoxide dehydrogenase small subunit
MTQINFTINNERRTITAPPMKRLLDVLREDLRLTGAKEGCGEGECGSCSILMNGELVNSCLIPILQAEGAQITTIEGLDSVASSAATTATIGFSAQSVTSQESVAPHTARAEGALYPSPGQRPGLARSDDDRGLKARATSLPQRLHPIQQCFLEKGGAQCGICTPGMILATHHLLDKYPHPTLEQIQEGLAGNLCRCTGYMRIFDAVQQAATTSSPAPITLVITP